MHEVRLVMLHIRQEIDREDQLIRSDSDRHSDVRHLPPVLSSGIPAFGSPEKKCHILSYEGLSEGTQFRNLRTELIHFLKHLTHSTSIVLGDFEFVSALDNSIYICVIFLSDSAFPICESAVSISWGLMPNG